MLDWVMSLGTGTELFIYCLGVVGTYGYVVGVLGWDWDTPAPLFLPMFWPIAWATIFPGRAFAQFLTAKRKAKEARLAEERKLVRLAEVEMRMDEIRSLPLNERLRVAQAAHIDGQIGWEDRLEIEREVGRGQ